MHLRIPLLALFLFSMGISFAGGPKVSFEAPKNFKIENFSKTNMKFSMQMNIKNETGHTYGVKLKKGKVYKNDKLIGTFKTANKLKLKRKSHRDEKITFQVEFTEPIKLASEGFALLTGKQPTFRFTGKVRANWFIFGKSFPIDYSQKVKLSDFFRR